MINTQAVLISLVLIIASYMLGNLSPATLVSRAHGVDIRELGSGNPGTTNVLRNLGKKAAAVTLLIDILKGFIPAAVGYVIGGYILSLAMGTAAFIGHIWPLFYSFKGGKGIATGFGFMLAFDPKVGLILLICAALGVLISRRVSVGSVAAAIVLPFALYFLDSTFCAVWGIVLALIVIWRHRTNIQRLIRGEEPPLSFGKKKE